MTKRDQRQLGLPLEGKYTLVPPIRETVPGSLNIAEELCGTLSMAIKQCGESRAVIAARMSDSTGQLITEAMINSWTSKSHDRHNMPAKFIPAFEEATRTSSLLELFAAKRNCKVLRGQEVIDAEVGTLARQISTLKKRQTQLTKKW